jgi:hypothetical protein
MLVPTGHVDGVISWRLERWDWMSGGEGSTLEAESGRLQVQGQPQLHNETLF